MAKLPSLEHVKYVRSRGKVYAYFNTGRKHNGKAIYARLPAPSAPDFYEKYAALKAGRTKRQAGGYTISQFADDYMKGSDYRDKAAATQQLYRIQLRKLTAILGKTAADSLTPVHVQRMLDNEGWGAATQNSFVSAVGALYAWGRKPTVRKVTAEPVKGIEPRRMGEHDPWPDHILEAALQADDDRVRLAAHVLYFTGLRIGDACALPWTSNRNGIITVTPTKTNRLRKTLYITVHSELQAELDRAPRKGITILTDADGRPERQARLRKDLQAFTRALGVETVPHGLRKNAVNALLEAGCTVAEVMSITGQTMQVVEHYAAKVNMKHLGQAAMLKFEARRKAK